jgi:hypothetical protein
LVDIGATEGLIAIMIRPLRCKKNNYRTSLKLQRFMISVGNAT